MEDMTTTSTIHHPVVERDLQRIAGDAQARLADAITRFAGSMTFVYIHAVLFALWMLVIEPDPWPTLTLVVSLEAIFLSTFVMIGQNRQTAFAQAKADHDFTTQEADLRSDLDLTRQIHHLTLELHQRVLARQPGAGLGDESGGPVGSAGA
jgi:uncharacterized membrane protein